MPDKYVLAQARAMADQQFAHVMATLDERVNIARGLLTTRTAADAWAIIGTDLITHADATNRTQQFAIEMLAAAIVTLAQGDTNSQEAEDSLTRTLTQRVGQDLLDALAAAAGPHTDSSKTPNPEAHPSGREENSPDPEAGLDGPADSGTTLGA
ncbi:hypothetical protein ACWDUL_38430 [Nocardia niigatensis]